MRRGHFQQHTEYVLSEQSNRSDCGAFVLIERIMCL